MGTIAEQGTKRLQGSENQGLWCEILAPGNIRSKTHKVSQTWMCKQELNKDGTNGHAKVDRKSPGDHNPTQRTADN